jgi:hypothetical protein
MSDSGISTERKMTGQLLWQWRKDDCVGGSVLPEFVGAKHAWVLHGVASHMKSQCKGMNCWIPRTEEGDDCDQPEFVMCVSVWWERDTEKEEGGEGEQLLKLSVLVWIGFYNKISETRWLINNRKLLLEAGSLIPRHGQSWCLKLQFWSWHLLTVSLHSKRGRERSWVSFVRALIPLKRTLPPWPSHLPKDPPPNTITLGMAF